MAVLAFTSCKKTKNTTIDESVLDYYPLAVGNYWVYEKSGCDSTWLDCNHISYDTSRITKDTVINDNVYFKLEGSGITGNQLPVYLRDSGSYIVNQTGQIIISNSDFDRMIYERYQVDNYSGDTLYYIFNSIKDKPNMVTVPSGSYDCIDFRGSFFRVDENFSIEYNYHHYFAKNVGPVYQNALFANSLGGLKKELVSYRLNKNE